MYVNEFAHSLRKPALQKQGRQNGQQFMNDSRKVARSDEAALCAYRSFLLVFVCAFCCGSEETYKLVDHITTAITQHAALQMS